VIKPYAEAMIKTIRAVDPDNLIIVRRRAQYAINKGLPIIISEWGSVTYSGDGYFDVNESINWMRFAKRNGLSHLNWAVSDKNESASMLRSGASSNGGWTERDLTPSGRLTREIMRNW